MAMTFDELEKLEKDYISCLKSDRQKTYEINVLARENRSLRAENESLLALAKLGRWALDMLETDGYVDLSAMEVMNKAVELKLMVGAVTERCGENCNCAQYGGFPRTCFRLVDKAQLPEKPASLEALHEEFLDYLDSKIPDFIKKIRDEKGEETPLAKLPDKRE